MSKATMSLDEKLDICNKALDLFEAGDEEGFDRLMNIVPMPPHLAMAAKKTMGTEFLMNSGWNLSEAEAVFGADWLSSK